MKLWLQVEFHTELGTELPNSARGKNCPGLSRKQHKTNQNKYTTYSSMSKALRKQFWHFKTIQIGIKNIFNGTTICSNIISKFS